jgi:hypothetical protein
MNMQQRGILHLVAKGALAALEWYSPASLQYYSVHGMALGVLAEQQVC